MADELLSYYNRELAYLRKLGAEFADLHPKVASRLRMSGEAVEDPHVLRLLEGVAFLNARVRRKLDDEFPELTHALLGQLYPHYLAPVPSLAIVQFTPAADLMDVRRLPAHSEIETEPVSDEVCVFRTTQDVDLQPVEITAAALTGRPLLGPASPRGAVGVVRLSLQTLQRETPFSQVAPDSLRFFLRGPAAEALPLYELLLNNVELVAVADGVNDPEPVLLGPQAVQPVGFAPDQGLLPYRPGSPLGYRLLTEYFVFPEKFLFFDIAGLGAKGRTANGRSLEIFLYLNHTVPELERSVQAGSFALGCTPVVNLFAHRAEPIPLTGTSVEYQIMPDARRGPALEVYSVDRVQATSPAGEQVEFAPIFGLRHAGAAREEARFWHAARRPGGADETSEEVFLSFVDLGGDPATPDQWVASVETTCSNRDLPAKLPFGGGHPYLRPVQSTPGVAGVLCLTAPTDALRLANRKESMWRLVSHLSLNHLSLTDSATGAEGLREILRLYDFRDAPETRALIDSVSSIRAKRSTARAPDRAMGALCRGLDVTIDFDEQRASGGVFLLAAVLEHFVGLYASINAFTRLTATVKGRSGILRTWPPRAGDLTLL
jgi:type VI secretion system protein ImpG